MTNIKNKKSLFNYNTTSQLNSIPLLGGSTPFSNGGLLAQKYYQQIICEDLLLKQNYNNIMELPSINKINLNTTSRLFVQDKKYILPAIVALEFITGQKIKYTLAKKSIATFKIRQNQILGCVVTLRNKYMYNFLYKFLLVIAPRLRDFSGVITKNRGNIDNFTLGIHNLMIFPELENHFELFDMCKGLNITFGISTKNINDTLLLYSAFQIPIVV
jgi:large subunit ribosomal protein L5